MAVSRYAAPMPPRRRPPTEEQVRALVADVARRDAERAAARDADYAARDEQLRAFADARLDLWPVEIARAVGWPETDKALRKVIGSMAARRARAAGAGRDLPPVPPRRVRRQPKPR